MINVSKTYPNDQNLSLQLSILFKNFLTLTTNLSEKNVNCTINSICKLNFEFVKECPINYNCNTIIVSF